MKASPDLQVEPGETAPVEPNQAVIATRARAIPRPSGSAAPIGCGPAPPPRGVNRQLSKLGARENADHPAAGESRRLTLKCQQVRAMAGELCQNRAADLTRGDGPYAVPGIGLASGLPPLARSGPSRGFPCQIRRGPSRHEVIVRVAQGDGHQPDPAIADLDQGHYFADSDRQ